MSQFLASDISTVNVGSNFFEDQGEIGAADIRLELTCDLNQVWRRLKLQGVPITDSDEKEISEGGGDLPQDTSAYGDADSLFHDALDEYIKSNWSHLVDDYHASKPTFSSQMVQILDALFGPEDLTDAPAAQSGERKLSSSKIDAWTQGYGDAGTFGKLVYTTPQVGQILGFMISQQRYVADTYDASDDYVADGSGANKTGHVNLSVGDMIGVRVVLQAENNDGTDNKTNQMAVHLMLKQANDLHPRMVIKTTGNVDAQGRWSIPEETDKDDLLLATYVAASPSLTVTYDLFSTNGQQVLPASIQNSLDSKGSEYDLQYKIGTQKFAPVRIVIVDKN